MLDTGTQNTVHTQGMQNCFGMRDLSTLNRFEWDEEAKSTIGKWKQDQTTGLNLVNFEGIEAENSEEAGAQLEGVISHLWNICWSISLSLLQQTFSETVKSFTCFWIQKIT